MNPTDDELRVAASPLADVSLPDGMFDAAFDVDPAPGRARALAAAAVAAVLVIAAGIAVGGRIPGPSTESSPSPSASASPEPTADIAGACEDIRAPSGGGDVILVYFPCAGPTLEQASGTRSVSFEMPVIEQLETAVRAVLDGPSELEQSAGMVAVVLHRSSALLAEVDLSEDDGLAILDFDPALTEINNLSTTSESAAFARSLEATVLQFDEVTAVEFQMGGSCDAFFEFFQSTCHHVAKPVEQVSDCPIVPPAELPSGAPITAPRPYPGQPMVSWGSGEDTVTEAPGHRDGGLGIDSGTPVVVRGYPGFVRPSGDMPLPQPMEIGWVEEGCPYRVFVALAGGEEAVIEYAARFGPSMAQPSPPPAEPVTTSVEEEGIRLTVTLDRDRTVFGQRVLATATIENIGTDSVFWGHSSTCVFPAQVQVRPDLPVRLEYGRDDWPGDDGSLKRVTLYQLASDADPVYGFSPEEWLDREGNFGCTTDLIVSELPAGESLVQRGGWDTLDYFAMPPPPGSYTVDAAFGFMSRGAPPSAEEGIDRFSVGLETAIVVEGPPIEYMSPGEAFDVLLADETFRDLLADVPRRMWLQSDITFIDGRFETALYFSERSSEDDPVEAIVATIDARSGIVLEVVREERAQPGGG